MTAQPDSRQGENDYTLGDDPNGTAGSIPRELKQDPLAGDDELVCTNCGLSGYLNPDRTRCRYCAAEQPGRNGRN